MVASDTAEPDGWLTRGRVVAATWALAAAASVAPLWVTVHLLDVAGVLFLLAGIIRLAHAAQHQRGVARLAGLTAVGLGVVLLAVSGVGLWSLPVMFALYLAIEAALRFVQAVRGDNLRLYSAGIVALLMALGIWQDVFCGGFALFGPLIALDLAAVGWAYAETPRGS